MESKYDYTVVLVSYNCADFVGSCIASFQKQKFPPLKIIVIDNHSTDDSIAVIKCCGYKNIDIIANKTNIGYAAALNQGIAACTSQYVVLANPDIYVDSLWSESVFHPFIVHDDCGLVASKILYWDDPKRINSVGMLFYRDLSAINRGLDELDDGQYDRHEVVFGAYGALMVFSKKVLDSVGLFDEDYWLFREEDEYMWRMHIRGWETYFSFNSRAFHKRSANTQLFSPLKLFYSERNRFWNVIKFMPLYCTVTMLPFVILRYLFNALILVKKVRSKKKISLQRTSKFLLIKTLINAWIQAIKSLSKMYCKRKIIFKNGNLTPYECRLLSIKYRAGLSDIIK